LGLEDNRSRGSSPESMGDSLSYLNLGLN